MVSLTARLDDRATPRVWQARAALALLDGVQSGGSAGGSSAVVELILHRVSQSWSDLERLCGGSASEVDVALTALAAKGGTSRETCAVRNAAIDLLCGLRLNGSFATGV